VLAPLAFTTFQEVNQPFDRTPTSHSRCSPTLVFGTLLSFAFLASGARRGEPVLAIQHPWQHRYAPALSFTSDAELLFCGVAMVLAARRGDAGCEVLAVPNWLPGRAGQAGLHRVPAHQPP
jgi:hypothetical protein